MINRQAQFLGRSAALASVAALALSAAVPSTAYARGHHWHGGGGAAAAAAFAGIVGTGLAIAAAQNRDSYAYYDGYYGAPAYYGGPVYYGNGPYYGSGPNYPYQRYGGTSPYEYCGQGYMTHCW